MNIYRLRTLCTEIYKTLNSLNPLCMKEIFQFQENKRSVRQQNINNLTIKTSRRSTFGSNSLSPLGPKVWNTLPFHLKCSESLATFKNMIKKWNGSKCCCNICQKIS